MLGPEGVPSDAKVAEQRNRLDGWGRAGRLHGLIASTDAARQRQPGWRAMIT